MAETACRLYRSLRYDDYPTRFTGTEDNIPDGLLYPRWQATPYTVRFKRNGTWVEEHRVSQADVRYNEQGKVKTGGGTSLFDCDGWFGFTSWHYFPIPKGTPIPDSLKLVGPGPQQTNASGSRTGHHYQIEVHNPMTPAAMKGALDTFQRAAIARNVQLAQTTT